MQNGFAFLPRAANQNPPKSQDVLAATTNAVQTLTLTNTGNVETECTIRVVNQGTDVTAWCFGVQAGLTLANGVFMLPNTVETFTLPQGVSALSVIGSVGGNSLRVIAGDGM
jgi:hypothetical protein